MFPDIGEQTVDLLHVLLNIEMQFQMHFAIEERHIMIIAHTVSSKTRGDQRLRSFFDIFFMNQHVNIATRSHPRFVIKRTDNRTFERNKRDLTLPEHLLNTLSGRSQLNLPINRHHVFPLERRADFLIFRQQMIFGERVCRQMRHVMVLGKPIQRDGIKGEIPFRQRCAADLVSQQMK